MGGREPWCRGERPGHCLSPSAPPRPEEAGEAPSVARRPRSSRWRSRRTRLPSGSACRSHIPRGLAEVAEKIAGRGTLGEKLADVRLRAPERLDRKSVV